MSYSLKINELKNWSSTVKKTIVYGDVLFFNGKMGAGKTTLISNIVKEFNSDIEVSSPTFSFFNVYPLAAHHQIIHVDAYRIEEPDQAFNLGLDYYNPISTIYMIEWAEHLPKGFLKPTIEISIHFSKDNNERIIQFDRL